MRSMLGPPALALGACGLLFGACWSDGPDPRAAVIYQGIATEEAWVEIDDHALVADDTMAPRLTSPTTISRSGDRPTFAWDGGAVASAAPRPAVPGPRAPRFAS